jgi:hypothetical protein
MWAVSILGTAPLFVRAATKTQGNSIAPVRFRLDRSRGLLVDVWLNGKGPFLFAVDTGAGMNLITQRTATVSQLTVKTVRPVSLGGLSGTMTTSNREAMVTQLALGDPANVVTRSGLAIVVPSLTSGVDGVLDPTEVFGSMPYTIDMPNRRIVSGGSISSNGGEQSTVPWIHFDSTSRPFVRLGDGRLALIDTGSNFGLAVNGRNAVVVGPNRKRDTRQGTRDLGGGTISSRRVAPTTISIGELELRRIPTDILYGITDDAPLILGRDALYPFRITFDPQRKLISFVTVEKG